MFAFKKAFLGILALSLGFFAPASVASPYYFDTFTDTDGVFLDAHTSDSGHAYTNIYSANTVKIGTNRVYPIASDFNTTYRSAATIGSANHDITAVVRFVTLAGDLRLYSRTNSSGNSGYMFYVGPTDLYIFTRDGGGGIASLGTVSYAFSAGTDYTIRCSLNGTSLSMYVNGVLALGPITNTTYTGVGVAAFNMEALVASPTTGLHLSSLSYDPLGASLVAGAATPVATSGTTTTVSGTAATGGTATFTYQLQRAPDASGSPGTFANIGSAQSGVAAGVAPTSVNDTGLTSGSTYWYRFNVTDSGAGSATGASSSVLMRVAATYYVSAAGNDSNNGTTTGAPFLTISKINTMGLVPGDTVLFNGGDTFSGNLLVNPSTAPGETTRIRISSYGTGKAIINPSNADAIEIRNCGYVTVNNIKVVGPGFTFTGSFPSRQANTTSLGNGVYVNSSAVATYREKIYLDDLDISGTFSGIQFLTSDVTCTNGFSRCRVTNCVVYNCANRGIHSESPGAVSSIRCNRFFEIRGCHVYNIWGIHGYGDPGGFGIYLHNSIDSIIENCVAHENAIAADPTAAGGACGFMLLHCTNVVVRYCEAYEIRSPGSVDGNGFETDIGNLDSIYDHCYAHDNDGANFQSFSATGTIIRYCISVKGGRRTQADAWNGNDATLYQNTFVMSGSSRAMFAGGNLTIRNNILVWDSSHDLGILTGAGNTLIGNCYYTPDGSAFGVRINSVDYASLAALRVGGFETVNGVAVGTQGDPMFTSYADTTVQMPANAVTNLSSYDIASGSAARGAGVPIQEMSLNRDAVPQVDWHNNRTVGTQSYLLSGIDAGAVRYGSAVPSAGGTHAFAF